MTGVFEDHLAVDAIVAFADGELGMTAFQRAAAHVARCPDCAAEVAEQTSAQQCLRSAAPPRMPGSLFDSLRSIPVALPASGPTVPGVHRDAVGRLQHGTPTGAGAGGRRRFRFGAGALVAGLAVGAFVTAAGGDVPEAVVPDSLPVAPVISGP